MTARFRYVSLAMSLALLSSVLPRLAQGDDFGSFVGRVATEWLEDGRRMKLLDSFAYLSPTGERWDAPAGAIVDGASIPQFAWSLIGGPFEGKYRNASVIHDVACGLRNRPWQDVHKAFYTGMLASGVEPVKAKVMYAAVYHFGPRWGREIAYRVPLGSGQGAAVWIASSARKGERAAVEIRSGPPTPQPCENCAAPLPPLPPTTEDVRVVFIPEASPVSREVFESLKTAIETRPLSLGEIEDFKPATPLR